MSYSKEFYSSWAHRPGRVERHDGCRPQYYAARRPETGSGVGVARDYRLSVKLREVIEDVLGSEKFDGPLILKGFPVAF